MRHLAQREAAHHQRQRLRAGDAAHAGDDGHQHRQRDDLLQRGLESADHPRRQERGRQIDAQPDRTALGRARHRTEQVLVLIQTGGAERLVFGLVADDVDHVVDGDAAQQHVVVVDDRRADPVVVREHPRHFVGGFLNADRRLFVVDQLVDRRAGVAGEQRLQRDAAEILMPAADHVQMIGMLRQFAAQAQVAQHHIHGGVSAHRDHVRIHQAAGGVLVVGQHLLQALAVLAIHRLQDFVDHRVRQILDQIRQIVDVEILDRGDQFVLVHVRDQAFAHVLADVDQHLTVVLGIDQPPDHAAFAGRQGFQQIADLGRRQRIDQPPHRTQAAAVERVGEQTQLTRGLVVADGLGHSGLPWRVIAPTGRDRGQVSMRGLSPGKTGMDTPATADIARHPQPQSCRHYPASVRRAFVTEASQRCLQATLTVADYRGRPPGGVTGARRFVPAALYGPLPWAWMNRRKQHAVSLGRLQTGPRRHFADTTRETDRRFTEGSRLHQSSGRASRTRGELRRTHPQGLGTRKRQQPPTVAGHPRSATRTRRRWPDATHHPHDAGAGLSLDR